MASLTADLTGSDPEEDTLFPEEAPAQRACISRRGIAMGVVGVFAFAMVVYVAFKPNPQKYEASAHTEDVMSAWADTNTLAAKNKVAGKFAVDQVQDKICKMLKETDLELMQKNIIDDVANTIVGKQTPCTPNFEGAACNPTTLVAPMLSAEMTRLQGAITTQLLAEAELEVKAEENSAPTTRGVNTVNDVANQARATAEDGIKKWLEIHLNRQISNKLYDAVLGKTSTWDSWEDVTSRISTPITEGFRIALSVPCTSL